MKEKEKKKKKRGRERRIENRVSGTRSVPPSPDAFPSAKLGNNITPIKGRLGKNTTPTSRGPTKMNQNLQADPRWRRSSFEVSFRADFSYKPKGAEYPKHKLHSDEAAFYKKDKSTRELVKSFPILQEPALKTLASFQELKVRGQRKSVQFTELFRSQGLSARSPVAHFDEFDYSTQVMQPKSQISSGYIANKASVLESQ